MPRRRRTPTSQQSFPSIADAEGPEYEALPPFASTDEEIAIAVEQNAQDRGRLLRRVIVSLQVDAVLEKIEHLAQAYDMEDFYQRAVETNIDPKALDHLRQQVQPIPFPYYFCLPETLVSHPHLVFYYRNVAMLSAKVMRGIGRDTQTYESWPHSPPDRETALQLARYFNGIISDLALQGSITPLNHIQMVMANVGDSIGGVARNEIGRVAMVHIINPIIRRFASLDRLVAVVYSLKGRIITPEEDEGSGAVSQQRILVTAETDIEALLSYFDEYRVIYHALEMSNGSRLLLNRQLTWYAPNGEALKTGPDMYSQVRAVEIYWAAEVKGGADPAGSDEHWKTATQALKRIREAAEKTKRDLPLLSFIATILVERVAREAQNWIASGMLTSVYNLTRMYRQDEEMERYLQDMTRFLGYTSDAPDQAPIVQSLTSILSSEVGIEDYYEHLDEKYDGTPQTGD
jgi:hypothetical protein